VAGGLGPEFFFLHNSGKVLSVTVTNQSPDVWTGFELELRSVFGIPSSIFDGLSFGKIGAGGGIDIFPPVRSEFASLLDETPCKTSNGYVSSESNRRFPCSDRFQQVRFDSTGTILGDKLTFSGGAVPPGRDATFTFLITENDPRNTFFYLFLRPQTPPEGPK